MAIKYKMRMPLPSVPIDNCPKYINFLHDSKKSDRKNFENMMLLTQDNRHTFKAIFGDCTGHVVSEFRYHFWRISYDNHIFKLLTAARKGTIIEIEDVGYNDIESKSKVIIGFVNELISRLKTGNRLR